MNDGALIILGVTGDLAKRKLIPALYHLFKRNRLQNVAIIGASQDDIAPSIILERAREHIHDIDEQIWQQLCNRFYYQQLDFNQEADYFKLKGLLELVEKKYSLSGNRLVYLACAAHFFCDITNQLGQSGITQKYTIHHRLWHRIIYEKPFGRDAQSAHQINECIARWFDESQIYRVDHYLTKELVSNISLLRFTNCVFEPLWNNRYIDHVQIILSESVGIENRGAYYDKYGALRDVVQNHMLELLAMTTMEAPLKLTGDYIRDERVKVLDSVRVIDGMLGQYETYRQEAYVTAQSTTETFAALYLAIENNRWAGVPFYLKTGKYLDKYEVAIHIKFKQVDHLLTKGVPPDSNWLTIRVAPDASFILSLNAKTPGRSDQLMVVPMEFCHSCMFSQSTPDAYEVLLEEVLAGEQATSVRFDEIESAWKVIDTVYAKKFPLYIYKNASTGPEQLTPFCAKHGMRWRS
jgi:glucose-6-phosphate 1-dehydrogenase